MFELSVLDRKRAKFVVNRLLDQDIPFHFDGAPQVPYEFSFLVDEENARHLQKAITDAYEAFPYSYVPLQLRQQEGPMATSPKKSQA